MYAIIKDGGHQYRVEMGQRIRVQKRDVEAGGVITFKEVCLLSTKDDEAMIGKPFVRARRSRPRCSLPWSRRAR